MSLPPRLAYLRDLAAAEAKRRGHGSVDVAHLAAAILKVEEEVLIVEMGDDAAAKVEAFLGPNGSEYRTPELTDAATATLEEAARSGGTVADVAREIAAGISDLPASSANGASRSAVATKGESDASGVAARQEVVAVAGIDELLEELDGLIGLGSVKAEINEIVQIKRIAEIRRQSGLPPLDEPSHLVFIGNPGTGKTTVARLLSRIYATLGVVPRGNFVEVSRADLVGGYVGQTAMKTADVVKRAVGGVLLVDEAYSLTRSTHDSDYGVEALDTLVGLMENHRSDLVVIVAGYPDEMKQFLGSNPGLKSRFGRFVEFPDYSNDDLTEIFQRLVSSNGLLASDRLVEKVAEFIESVPRTKEFGNARMTRNLFRHVLGRQAVRLAAYDTPDREALVRLEEDDFQLEEPDRVDEPGGMYL